MFTWRLFWRTRSTWIVVDCFHVCVGFICRQLLVAWTWTCAHLSIFLPPIHPHSGGMGLCLSPNNARVSLAVAPVALPDGGSERLHAFWTVCLMPPLFKHSKMSQMRQKLEIQWRDGAPGNRQALASAANVEEDFFFDDRLDNAEEAEDDAQPTGNQGNSVKQGNSNNKKSSPHDLLDPAKLVNIAGDGFRAVACLHLVLTDGLSLEAEQQQKPGDEAEVKESDVPHQRQQQQHQKKKASSPPDGPIFRRLRNAIQDSYTLQELLQRLPGALGPQQAPAATAVHQLFRLATFEETVPLPSASGT